MESRENIMRQTDTLSEKTWKFICACYRLTGQQFCEISGPQMQVESSSGAMVST